MKKFSLSILTGLVLFFPSFVSASGKGTFAGEFLNIQPGARPMGMGGSFYGLSDDLNSVQWNPAGLSEVRHYALDTHYSVLYEGISYGGLTLGIPMRGDTTIGLSYSALDSGGITKAIATNRGLFIEDSGDFHVKDTLLTLTIANGHYFPWEVGVNIKGVSEDIDGTSASALLFDGGVLWTPTPRIRFGAGVQNFGGGEFKFIDEEAPIAQTVLGGGAFRLMKEKNTFLTFEVDSTEGHDTAYSFGGEYVFTREKQVEASSTKIFRQRGQKEEPVTYEHVPTLALRAGLRPSVADQLGSAALPTFGLGFYFGNFRMDYAFVSAGDLGLTHRMSLGYLFGKNSPSLKDWGEHEFADPKDDWGANLKLDDEFKPKTFAPTKNKPADVPAPGPRKRPKLQ